MPFAAGASASDIAPALRRHLSARLPDYMIPSVFITLEKFPLTPNGKVDRKALPAPSEVEAPAAPRQVVAPRNETEAKLLEIWKQVLGKDDLGVEDDIFELGGDSILIFQITTRATRAGLALTPGTGFPPPQCRRTCRRVRLGQGKTRRKLQFNLSTGMPTAANSEPMSETPAPSDQAAADTRDPCIPRVSGAGGVFLSGKAFPQPSGVQRARAFRTQRRAGPGIAEIGVRLAGRAP